MGSEWEEGERGKKLLAQNDSLQQCQDISEYLGSATTMLDSRSNSSLLTATILIRILEKVDFLQDQELTTTTETHTTTTGTVGGTTTEMINAEAEEGTTEEDREEEPGMMKLEIINEADTR